MPAAFEKLRFHRHASWRHGRLLCAWFSTALYLTVATGIPLPAPQAVEAIGKDTSQPFPCMNSPCGCRNAEQCWRHCCCHTLAERLEWARQNQVQPPDYVLAEAKARGVDLQSPPEHDCCAEQVSACCCCHTRTTEADEHDDGNHKDGQPHHRDPSSPGIVVVKALECQGIGGNLMTSIVSLCPPLAVRWEMAWNPLGRITCSDRFPSSFSAQPPTPPPRIGLT